MIDAMGKASANAQGLNRCITSWDKVCANKHNILIMAASNTCTGFIKVGHKKLFVRNRAGNIIEMSPMAVLDFYVHNTV